MNSHSSPSLAYSSRDLFLGVALVGVLLGVFSTFGLFFAAPLALAVSIALFYYGHRQKRRPYIWAARLLMLPSACLTGVVVFAMFMFGAGPVYSRSDWPDSIYYIARVAENDTSNVKMSSLGRFIDEEYVWRQPFISSKLPDLADKFQLTEIPPQDVSPEFFEVFPYLWRPSFGPNCTFYATQGFDTVSRGNDGEHYYIMFDPDTQMLYVWYKDNF
jgi:hypothetical protein